MQMNPHFCKVLAGMEIVMKKLIFNIHVKYFLLFSLNTDTLKICTLAITVHGSFLAKKKIFSLEYYDFLGPSPSDLSLLLRRG